MFDRRLAEWEQAGLVGRLFAGLDAVHSSGAEGSTTTFTDLLEYESSLKSAPDADDAASVAACAEAIEETLEGDLVETAKRLHARLFGVRPDRVAASRAGRLKETTNGTMDSDAPGGHFFYTKPDSLSDTLAEWQAFTLRRDPATPELPRQILSHWMFEHIHPVHDGNGRIGRLLVPLTLREKRVTKTACAFFSEAVHEDEQLYVEALKQARPTGDMTGFARLMLDFLLRGRRGECGPARPSGRDSRRLAQGDRDVSRACRHSSTGALRLDASRLHHRRRARGTRRNLRLGQCSGA